MFVIFTFPFSRLQQVSNPSIFSLGNKTVHYLASLAHVWLNINNNTSTLTELFLTGGGENILATRLVSELLSSCVASAHVPLLLAQCLSAAKFRGPLTVCGVDQVTG